MTRLYFIHKENANKISPLKKKEKLVYLDKQVDIKKNKKIMCLEHYIRYHEQKKNNIRACYNLEWLQKWAFKKTNGKKSFAKELIYEGKSFWYPLEFFIHYDVDFLSSDISLSRILLYVDCIKKIIHDLKPTNIIIENDKTCFNRIVILICKKEKIKIQNLRLPNKKEPLSKIIINNPLTIKTYLKSRILLRKIIANLFCKKIKPKDILVLTSDRLSNKENKTDYYWGPLVEEMDKNKLQYKVVEYDRIDVLNSLGQVKKRYIPQKYDAQFIGTYYDRKTTQKTKKIICFLKKKFRELDNTLNFRKSLNYEGINIYELIRPRLKKIFLSYSYYIADVYALSKSVIEKDKPKLILVDHEKNYYGRALITEANLKNIPTIAFEGELLYGNNTYQTQIPVQEILNKKSMLWRPIPSMKFLWGNFAKQWHSHKNFFPKETLKVIGAPKYDFIRKFTFKDKQEIKRKFKIKKEDKLITIITEKKSWEEKYLTDIFQAINNFTNLKIIIKMHPNDPSAHEKNIKELRRKHHIQGHITIHEDISKIMYTSDLVISYSSTLVYECILMNKNIILIGFVTNKTHPYITEGFIKPIESIGDLKKQVTEYLLKNKKLNVLLRQKFIKKYLYSDDGKASERAIAYIKTFLK